MTKTAQPFAIVFWRAGRAAHGVKSRKQKEGNMLSGIPDDWGRKLNVHHGAVTNTRTGPNAIRMRANACYILVMFTAQPIRRVALNSDRVNLGFAPVGTLEIVPQGAELFAQWETQKENLLIAITGERLKTLAGREYQTENFEFFPPRLGFFDAKALAIAKSIRGELQAGEFASNECIDAWLTIFAIHLLRNHSNLGERLNLNSKGGISIGTWRRIDDFIRSNLAENLTLDRLAEIACLSPSHFVKSFRETVGQAPHQYVLSLRLDLARKMIVNKSSSFEEIAKISGFSSNSHMTATMRRFWGTSPTLIRRSRN